MTYLGRVPGLDGLNGTGVGPRNVALSLPAVLGHEAIGAVRTGDGSEGARTVVVASVVGNGGGADGRGGNGEDGEDGSEMHLDWVEGLLLLCE